MRTLQLAGTILLVILAWPSSSGARTVQDGDAGLATIAPMAFVENRGQWDTEARFIARAGPLSVGTEPRALVLAVEEGGEHRLVRLEFDNAREDARIEGQGVQTGVRHYYVGDDPERWRTGVESYARVLYRGLYEGVDLRVRDHRGSLEYDLLLAPGADLEQVRVRCDGVESLEIEPDGSLVLHTGRGSLRQSPPTTWNVLPSGERREVECRFELLGDERFGFRVEDRDPTLELVVDPELEWCTYLGGNDSDFCVDSAFDPSGRVVLVGRTYSTDFPAEREHAGWVGGRLRGRSRSDVDRGGPARLGELPRG